MSNYDAQISRTDAAALIPEDEVKQIFQQLPTKSTVMQLMRRLPNMTTKQEKIPVLSVLPTAYFVDGDTGLMKASEQKWEKKYLKAEKLAVIVPVPVDVIDDAEFDMWAEIRPRIVEAMGKAVDGAVLVGTNAPADWPDDILTAATAASQTVELNSVGDDLYDDIMAENGLIDLVESKGFMVDGYIALPSMKAKLRALRDAVGNPIFYPTMQTKGQYELDGEVITFSRNASFANTSAYMFAGNWKEAVYSIRKDVRFEVLTEAVIMDDSNDIIYNFAQQDMVGLKVTMRLAWQVPNPVNLLEETEANRYPFSVLIPAS